MRTILPTLIFLALCLFAVGCIDNLWQDNDTTIISQGQGTLQVTVMDAEGEPLAGVYVMTLDENGYADENYTNSAGSCRMTVSTENFTWIATLVGVGTASGEGNGDNRVLVITLGE
jgi:hypothetical protein